MLQEDVQVLLYLSWHSGDFKRYPVTVSIISQLGMSWFAWQKPQREWHSTELWFEALELEAFPWLCCAQAAASAHAERGN